MSKFNENFKCLKEYHGLKVIELAKKLDVAISSMSTYLRYREPDYDTLMKIAREFNVSINWLIGYDDPNEGKNIGVEKMLLNVTKENQMLKRKLEKLDKVLHEEEELYERGE